MLFRSTMPLWLATHQAGVSTVNGHDEVCVVWLLRKASLDVNDLKLLIWLVRRYEHSPTNPPG